MEYEIDTELEPRSQSISKHKGLKAASDNSSNIRANQAPAESREEQRAVLIPEEDAVV